VFSELANIADSVNPEGLRLLYWDTEVCGDEYYERGAYQDMISSTKPKGGGGTDVACVSQYVKEKDINAQGIVIITDGYLGGDWGEWDKPVLWVMIDNPSTTAPIGHTVHVKVN
jgi:predicted metal-dependent peptidase